MLRPVERLIYRLIRVDPSAQQDWKSYARTTIVFSALFWVALYLILRTQGIHPFNPEGFHSGTWDVTFNTTSSFISNTNWQYYGGETTMTYFSQMAGLAVQNFVSAAVGMAVLAAVIRGFVSRAGSSLGNFWQDLTRALLYVLLPISVVGALFLVSQGVIQNLAVRSTFATLAGGEQTLALGPVASQIAIKELGTNGGGFFNVNSAMPFENPSGISNFFEMLFILLIPAALTADFGRMVGNRRQGWALYAAMLVMFVAGGRGRLPRRAERLARAEGRRSPPPRVDGDRRQPRGQGGPLRDPQQRGSGRPSRPWLRAARSTPRSTR